MLKYKKKNDTSHSTKSLISHLSTIINNHHDDDDDDDDDDNDKMYRFNNPELANKNSKYNYNLTIPSELNISKIDNNNPFKFCIFQVRTDGKYPFLLYFIEKKMDTKRISFISSNINIGINSIKKIKYKSLLYVNNLFPNADISYHGIYTSLDDNIILLKIEDYYNQSHIYADNLNNYIWATSHEILNNNKILDYTIENNVIDFFIKNKYLIYLKNNNNFIFETPIICYYKITNTLENIELADIYHDNIIKELSPGYYLHYNIPKSKEYETLLRIIVFVGNVSFKQLDIYNNDETIDSLFFIHKNINKYYLIKNYDQHTILSVF